VKKYYILLISSFIIEMASTFYIKTVSERSILMLFWAFIGPFLGLPFVGYMVETKEWDERIKMAFVSGVGYLLGALLVYLYTRFL
jgi:heme/copper-type cytochrome/quinol oxidase subunit 3